MNHLVSTEYELRDLISLSPEEQAEYCAYLDEKNAQLELPLPEYFAVQTS